MDRRVGQEVLKVISCFGVEASLKAIEELSAGDVAQRAALSAKLEQLEYEARKAFEQYDAVDARNRLVAGELERRWNEKLEEVEAVRERMVQHLRGKAEIVEKALAAFQEERMTDALRLQNAARNSMEWFENVRRYTRLDPPQFAYSLLTRSQRISHENLRLRDPDWLRSAEDWFQAQAGGKPGRAPMFAPFRLRNLELWYSRLDVSRLLSHAGDQVSRRERTAFEPNPLPDRRPGGLEPFGRAIRHSTCAVKQTRRRLATASIKESASRFKAFGEIGIIQGINSYAATAGGRIDELLLAYIDTHMRVGRAQCIEKHQVAGAQL